MLTVVSPEKLYLSAGTVMRSPATWQEYQALCKQRGDGSIPRLKYRSGEVLLMSPLPRHGRDVSLIADIVKVLLDSMGQDYDAFTPVTMQLPEESGIEPDYCFYIDNWQAISGKERIDWLNDPPPDLVLEIDITSYSDVQDYLPYEVPEVWLFRNQQLMIYQLQGNTYIVESQSRYFGGLNVPEIVSRGLTVAYERNTSTAIRELRRSLG
ncbi:MAG: Uma2 family endonuclease [Oscillatoria sp. PMC 1068.18]|nr:Uma2 family endonuclease [Oscillatoria sp. PMC 1076.18]MEC4987818.1 Uma2 family endonuclease [Oscillatoria sp. PMC 1068.18]